MGMLVILFNGKEPFEQTVNIPLTENIFSTFSPYGDTNLTLPWKGQRSSKDHHLNKAGRP